MRNLPRAVGAVVLLLLVPLQYGYDGRGAAPVRGRLLVLARRLGRLLLPVLLLLLLSVLSVLSVVYLGRLLVDLVLLLAEGRVLEGLTPVYLLGHRHPQYHS